MLLSHFKQIPTTKHLGKNVTIVSVDGESMYPSIKNGAVVCVDEDARFSQNEIFIVRLPHGGITIKRVEIDYTSNQYILRFDNLDKKKFDGSYLY